MCYNNFALEKDTNLAVTEAVPVIRLLFEILDAGGDLNQEDALSVEDKDAILMATSKSLLRLCCIRHFEFFHIGNRLFRGNC